MVRWFMFHVVWPLQERWFWNMMQEERHKVEQETAERYLKREEGRSDG